MPAEVKPGEKPEKGKPRIGSVLIVANPSDLLGEMKKVMLEIAKNCDEDKVYSLVDKVTKEIIDADLTCADALMFLSIIHASVIYGVAEGMTRERGEVDDMFTFLGSVVAGLSRKIYELRVKRGKDREDAVVYGS